MSHSAIACLGKVLTVEINCSHESVIAFKAVVGSSVAGGVGGRSEFITKIRKQLKTKYYMYFVP